jgi:hypothetical protein
MGPPFLKKTRTSPLDRPFSDSAAGFINISEAKNQQPAD